jgi:putative peptidoglycan binding protein/L,D-transpeptidase-like protein
MVAFARSAGRTCGLLVVLAAVALVVPGTTLAAGHTRHLAAAGAQLRAAPTLKLGSKGPAVRALQKRLAWAAYLPWGSAVDGVFGTQTWHAVVAFQGWNGLSRDGVVGPATQAALARARRPRAWSGTTGLEIHLAQQVMLLVRDQRVELAVHVSTGRPGYGTPTGFFRIYRRESMSWSYTFHTWMPLAQYFYGGYATHEYSDVPAYPASHGCVRVPASYARTVWNFGYIGLRVRVLGP